jgi:hypothetical protein
MLETSALPPAEELSMDLSNSQWLEWHQRENPHATMEQSRQALKSYIEICAKFERLKATEGESS